MQFIRWLWSDPETMKPVGGPIHLTDDQARRWFAQKIDPGSPTDCYRLIFNEENKLIGELIERFLYHVHYLHPHTSG